MVSTPPIISIPWFFLAFSDRYNYWCIWVWALSFSKLKKIVGTYKNVWNRKNSAFLTCKCWYMCRYIYLTPPNHPRCGRRALAFCSRFGQKTAIAIVYIVTAVFCPFSILIMRSHLYVHSKLEIRCASGILDDWGCISIITIVIVQNETK